MKQSPSPGVPWARLACALPALALAGCNWLFGIQQTELVPDKNSITCSCQCRDLPVSGERAVSLGADDGQQSSQDRTRTDLRGPTLDFGVSALGINTVVGVRFQNVGIPRNAVIEEAYVQFTAAQAAFPGIPALEIRGEESDNAPEFSAQNQNQDIVSRLSHATAPVAWNITDPWNVNDAGPAQRTPDIKSVLQPIVNRAGWDPMMSALVILITGTSGRSAQSYDSSPAAAPRLVVRYSTVELNPKPTVCVPDALNSQRGGSVPADSGPYQTDCATRVANTLTGLSVACLYTTQPCTCEYVADSARAAAVCNQPCTENQLASDCSNLDPKNTATATNAPGDAQVCTVHSPLGAAIFGRRSQCNVNGTATLATSDETATTGAHGTIEFIGDPCPGQSCAVGIAHRFDLDDIHFTRLFASATISELAALGGAVSGATAQLQADGTGAFGAGTTESTGRGRRDNGQTMAVLASNADVIHVGVGWGAATCSLDGALVGSVDPENSYCENAGPYAGQLCYPDVPAVCGSAPECTGAPDPAVAGANLCRCEKVAASSDATVSLDVTGTLVNQPPTANAGPDQVIECNRTNRGAFDLNATASHDPDGNVASFVWLRGSRTGDRVGFQPVISLEQAVGTQVRYIFRLLDTFAQADESTTQVSVVDTTPPTIECNAPATIKPTDAPVTFTATATDVCDPDVSTTVGGFTCYWLSKYGKTIIKNESCVVSVQGGAITIVDSGGIGDHVQWQVSAADDSGNVGHQTCEVVVVAPR